MSTPQTPPARKRITLLALCLAAFIISLDVTIVNVALPTLVRQTSATTTDLQVNRLVRTLSVPVRSVRRFASLPTRT
jgi:hypothetical protein